jgi:hypothetical protein
VGGSNVGLAIARCNVPAMAVDACLKRRAPAERSECLELAAHVMAATTLTRQGYDADSHDTLHCTYIALVTLQPAGAAPDTVFMLSLGLLLSARGAAWPLALLRFDAAQLAQPRLQAREAALQAALREVYAERGASAARPSAEALLRGAETLELFAALRGFAFLPLSADALAANVERVQEAQEMARDRRKRQLLPAVRQLAALLLRDDDVSRAALHARAGALLTALDVASMGDCAVLARRLEAHAALLLECVRRGLNEEEAEEALRGLDAEVEDAMERVHRLTPVDACARTVVATTDSVEALFHYMVLLQQWGSFGPVIGHMVLPPPRGEAPHAKSPAAVAEAFRKFEMITGQVPLNGGLPLPPQRKRQQPQRSEPMWRGVTSDEASAARLAQPRDAPATPPRREPQGMMIKEGGRPDEAAATAAAAAAAAAGAAAPRDTGAVLALGARLLGLLLLSAAAWRLAAAAERRRHKAHGA